MLKRLLPSKQREFASSRAGASVCRIGFRKRWRPLEQISFTHRNHRRRAAAESAGAAGSKVAQQLETSVEWKQAIGARRIALPCVIRLTRIGCKKLDSDNCAGAFKHVRDAIAREIGIDDGSELLRFEYAQEVIAKRQYAVRVEVMSR